MIGIVRMCVCACVVWGKRVRVTSSAESKSNFYRSQWDTAGKAEKQIAMRASIDTCVCVCVCEVQLSFYFSLTLFVSMLNSIILSLRNYASGTQPETQKSKQLCVPQLIFVNIFGHVCACGLVRSNCPSISRSHDLCPCLFPVFSLFLLLQLSEAWRAKEIKT